MNYSMVFYLVGNLFKAEAGLMLLPVIVALIYREEDVLPAFFITIFLLLLLGLALTFKPPKNRSMRAREGFFIVGISWILLSVFGSLPFVFSGEIPHFVDAFFETVSGFTTTGASILTNVEALSHSILFWRSFTHWVGGMGVLVFVLAILPNADAKTLYVMRAEVPGPTCDKLVAKVRRTALILYGIYFAMTVILILLLLLGGMPLFDSMLHAFGTAGTGGFGIKSNSVEFYQSPYLEMVIGIFMILFGTNFNLYYFLLLGNFSKVFKSEELRWYLGIIAAAVGLITIDVLPCYGGSPLRSLRYAFFQVSSIITTTGFTTADYGNWPVFSQTILVMIMFFGAMAGSTGGGIKISRVAILCKSAIRNMRSMLSPRSVRSLKFEGKTMEKQTLSGIHCFLTIYVILFLISVLLLSVDQFDHVSNLSAVAACFNNIGPALGICGPVGSYAPFSDFSKLVLSFDMLAGRLEIFPMLLLFLPATYRRH